ncbi:MAG TPA: ATP-dependent Clp protease adaptor ClpS [Thermodesulfobacteriaceae bacterium]|nr:ATP-dependent Clp protease adaptor ClpS [Thermodesulfobacteriaceae bacterium]
MGRFELNSDSEKQHEVLTERAIEEPPRYRVLLHNDDYTTMDFVVHILETVFHKSPSEAISIMLNVHQTGVGVCGSYPPEIAETKIEITHNMAREAGFPLKASMERE